MTDPMELVWRLENGAADAHASERSADKSAALLIEAAACIRDMIPPVVPGKGLIVLRAALIDQEMARRGIEIESGRARRPLDTAAYHAGQRAADKVALNQGLGGSDALVAFTASDHAALHRRGAKL